MWKRPISSNVPEAMKEHPGNQRIMRAPMEFMKVIQRVKDQIQKDSHYSGRKKSIGSKPRFKPRCYIFLIQTQIHMFNDYKHSMSNLKVQNIQYTFTKLKAFCHPLISLTKHQICSTTIIIYLITKESSISTSEYLLVYHTTISPSIQSSINTSI